MSNGVTFTVRSPKFGVGDYVKWKDVQGYVKAGTGKIVKGFSASLYLSFDKEGQYSSLCNWSYVIEDSNGQILRSAAPESELSYISSEEFILNIVKDLGVTIDQDKLYLKSYNTDYYTDTLTIECKVRNVGLKIEDC